MPIALAGIDGTALRMATGRSSSFFSLPSTASSGDFAGSRHGPAGNTQCDYQSRGSARRIRDICLLTRLATNDNAVGNAVSRERSFSTGLPSA